MRKRKGMNRLLVLLCAVLLLGLLTAPAMAAEDMPIVYPGCAHHTHDESCGGLENNCTDVCQRCIDEIQSLVNILPGRVKLEGADRENAAAQMEAIDELRRNATDATQAQIDWTNYEQTAFVLSPPDGFFGFLAAKKYEAGSPVTPQASLSFLSDGVPATLYNAQSIPVGTSAQPVSNGEGVYYYLPAGTYTVAEEVDGYWDMTLTVDGETKAGGVFTGEAGEYYTLTVGNILEYADVWVGGTQLTKNAAYVNGITFTYEDGGTSVLTLENVSIQKEGYPAIQTEIPLKIEVKGHCYLHGGIVASEAASIEWSENVYVRSAEDGYFTKTDKFTPSGTYFEFVSEDHTSCQQIADIKPERHQLKCKCETPVAVLAQETCVGGSANCKKQAVCDACRQVYGTVNPNVHETPDSLKRVRIEGNKEKHQVLYACCDAVHTEEESHTDAYKKESSGTDDVTFIRYCESCEMVLEKGVFGFPVSGTYDGNARYFAPHESGNTLPEGLYEKWNAEAWVSQKQAPVDVGLYRLTIKWGKLEETREFEIKRAPLTVTPEKTTATKIYDGTDTYSGNIALNLAGLVEKDKGGSMTATAKYNSANVADATHLELTPTAVGFDLNNYSYELPEITATITPKELNDPVVTLDKESYTYTGSKITPEVTVKDGETELNPETDYQLTYGSNTTVEEGIKVFISMQGNYKNSENNTSFEFQFPIAKADPVTADPTGLEATFGDTLGSIDLSSAVVKTAGTWSWKAGGDILVGDAGDKKFEATFTPEDTVNYNSYSTKLSVTVNKATLTFNAPMNVSGTYGQKLSQLEIEAPTGAAVTFKNEVIAGTWRFVDGDAVPSAGTSTMQAVFTPASGAANFNELKADVHLDISPKTLDESNVSGVEASYSYTGEPIRPTVTVRDGAITLAEGTDYTVTYGNNTTVTEGGTVTVAFTGNYTGEAVKKNFVIEKVKPVVTVPTAASLTYKGEEQRLVSEGSAVGGQITYALGDVLGASGEYSSSVPTAKNAGRYYVWYKVTGDANHLDKAPAMVKVSIDQKELTPTLTGSVSKVYDGTSAVPAEHSLHISVTGVESSDSVAAKAGSFAYGAEGVGSHNVTAAGITLVKDAEGYYKNYKLVSGSAEAEVGTILPRDISQAEIELVGSLTYNGAEQKQWFRVKLDNLNVTFDCAGDRATEAGNYTLTVTGLTNFTGTKTQNWSIAQKPLTVTAKDQTITYDDQVAQYAFEAEGLISGHELSLVLRPNTDQVTDNGTITPSEIKITANGTDVTENYDVTAVNGKLVIKAVSQEVEQIAQRVGSYSAVTVKPSDKAAIEALLADIEEQLEEEGLNADEKKSLQQSKQTAQALLKRLEDAKAAANTESIRMAKTVTSDNVQLSDQQTLEKARIDLNNALTVYGGNYTDAEKKAMQDEITRINGVLQTIENTKAVVSQISQLPGTVEPDDEDTREKILAAEASYNALTEHERSLVNDTARNKLFTLLEDMRDYKIVKGSFGKWSKGTYTSLSFTANGPFSEFVRVKVDGEEISRWYYTADSGSTIINLRSFYLRSLKDGKHILTVEFTDGEAECPFYIQPKGASPGTGDAFNPMVWGGILAVSAAGLAVLLIVNKKKKK